MIGEEAFAEHAVPSGADRAVPSIAERVGYDPNELADRTANALRDTIARRMPRPAGPLRRDLPVQTSVPAVPASPEAVPASPEPEHEIDDVHERVAQAHVLREHEEAEQERAEEEAEREAQLEEHREPDADEASHERSGVGSSSGGSSASGAATPVAENPASEASLTREDIGASSEEAVPEESAVPSPVPAEPAPPAASEVQAAPTRDVTIEMLAPAHRVRVRAGEPIVDAQFVKNTKFQFDDSGTKQVTQFPLSLEAQLRDDLAAMTNEEFARDVSLPAMLAAFVASQLGAVADKEAAAELDENTRTALLAFRMLDRRTGSIEGRLADLDVRTQEMAEYLQNVQHVLKRHAEETRVIENGVVYLVTERLEPSRVANVPLTQVQLIDGKYRQTRDRLKELTDREIRDEKISRGRPIR